MNEVAGDIWESDPSAIKALESFRAKYPGAVEAVDIRCAVQRKNGPCGEQLGSVWFSEIANPRGAVLCLRYWPDALPRTRANRRELCLFLEKAGDHGLYSCRRHGTWRADLREVRNQFMTGLAIGHPRMSLPASPPVRDAAT